MLLRQRAHDGGSYYAPAPGERATLEQYRRSGILAAIAARQHVEIPPLTAVADVGPIPARIHMDMWIVDCPDCRDAQLAWRDPPLYMCCYCWNARVGNRWRPVAFPPAEQQLAAEQILGHRALPDQRNWIWTPMVVRGAERGAVSLAELAAQNREAGDDLPAWAATL